LKINRLLLVPSDRIEGSDRHKNKSVFGTHTIRRVLKPPQFQPYDAEMLLYGDLPIILGANNVFVYSNYQKQYFHKKISTYCAYPSCCKTPHPTFITKQEIPDLLNLVDIVLVSSRSTSRGDHVIKEAKKRDLPVIIIDIQDHESLYGSTDVKQEMTRGFIKGRDFDLYFKKELLLDFMDDTFFPLAPTPVRPNSYDFPVLKKENDVFYTGRKRDERCQLDRSQSVRLIKDNFNNCMIWEHDSRSTFLPTRDYWANISKSRITLSPSGRSWDSFRHCEVGLTGSTTLLAPKPYIETVGPPLKDNENAILYDTKFLNGRSHLTNESDFIDKVKYYLDNPGECAKMGRAWNQDVLSSHTILARSHYIIDTIEKSL